VSTLVQPAEAARARGRKRTGVRPRRRVDRGIVWIAALAVLLAGVVAVNVAVLQLNVRLDELGGERAQLRDENARIRAELSSTAANARIEQRATSELGLVVADPEATTYVDLGKRP
jgi:cell division protein FtsL